MAGTVAVLRALRRARHIEAPTRLVIYVLAGLADFDTGAVPERLAPSLTDLQEMTHLSRSALADHLRHAEAAGWLARVKPAPELARSVKARTQYCVRVGRDEPPTRRPAGRDASRTAAPASCDAGDVQVASVTPDASPSGGLVRQADQPDQDNSASPSGGLVRQADQASPPGVLVPHIPSHTQPPPTPRDPLPASRDQRTGEGDLTPDELIDTLLDMRPDWSSRTIRRVLDEPDIARRPWHIVVAAAVLMARDRTIERFTRLLYDGPFWAEAVRLAAPATPPTLTPPCGECGPYRQVEGPDGRLQRCPKCHPLASPAGAA